MSKALELADILLSRECSDLIADVAAAELRRLDAIEAAARNLVKVKGRYHTEQAFKALVESLKGTP